MHDKLYIFSLTELIWTVRSITASVTAPSLETNGAKVQKVESTLKYPLLRLPHCVTPSSPTTGATWCRCTTSSDVWPGVTSGLGQDDVQTMYRRCTDIQTQVVWTTNVTVTHLDYRLVVSACHCLHNNYGDTGVSRTCVLLVVVSLAPPQTTCGSSSVSQRLQYAHRYTNL